MEWMNVIDPFFSLLWHARAECYLDQMCSDLTAYADHAGDAVVDNKKVELLMLR
jgi:hypothetical protein